MGDRKLTKRQRKSLAFRERKATKSGDILLDLALQGDIPTSEPLDEDENSQHPRKRKRAPSEIDLSLRPSKIMKGPNDTDDNTSSLPNNISGGSRGLRAQTRYILFVGNLKYLTTKEAIIQHFSLCDPPPTVRLITLKGSGKSKGCAFVEFTHRNALQQGLKLHLTELDGRKINVELTAGGGGKSEVRVQKLKERNQQLERQRVGISIIS